MQKKQTANAGVAMILTLCAAALFLAFTAALVYSASVLLASANALLPQERCYQQAKTFSDVLENELCSTKTTPNGLQTTVNAYIQKQPDGVLTPALQGTPAQKDANYGDVSLTIQITPIGDSPNNSLSWTYSDTTGALDEFEKTKISDYQVILTATVKIGDQTANFSRAYTRQIQYNACQYAMGGKQIYRAPGQNNWYNDANLKSRILDAYLKSQTIIATYIAGAGSYTTTFVREGTDNG